MTPPLASSIMRAAVALVTEGPHRAPDDLDRARTCVLHYIACAINGRALPWSQVGYRLALQSLPAAAAAGASLVGSQAPVAAESAVMANAIMGQSTLAEDVHGASLVHPGSMVISAALAAAERAGSTEEELLRGVVAGYDVVAAVATSLKTAEFVRRGLRPSGIFGPLGAAAAAASLWGLTPEQTASCLGIAANTGAGLREWANAGTTDIYVQNGVAARNGYLAALLAEQGITGPGTAFDGSAGLAAAMSGAQVDWSPLLQAHEAPAAVRCVEFKRYPACSAVQTVLDVAASLGRRAGWDPAAVESVEVRTHAHGKHNPGCDSTGPWQDVGQAQMSNQLGVALALQGRPMTVDAYAHGMADPVTLSLARAVTVVEDTAMSAVYPGRSEACLVVRLRDGSVVEAASDVANPLSDAEAREMFRAAAVSGLRTSADVAAAIAVLEEPDPARPIARWTDVLRAVTAPDDKEGAPVGAPAPEREEASC